MIIVTLILSGINVIMKKLLNTEILDKALTLLAGRLEIDGLAPISIIVCGGSSLIATGLVKRATKDVDIVALLSPSSKLESAKPLPKELLKASAQVARDLGLSENWLNSDPGDLMEFGFPDGFLERLQKREYGKRLTVNYIGRLDQIHFKVYAAVDQGPGHHVDDLRALEPTFEEMEAASRWAMTHDQSEGFRAVLIQMLEVLGYESVAEKI